MIAAHGEAHTIAYDRLTVDDNELFLTRTDGDDAGFRRIDDCRELIDAEHAKVTHRERRASELFRLELPLASTLGELFGFLGDVAHALLVGFPDDRDNESVIGS